MDDNTEDNNVVSFTTRKVLPAIAKDTDDDEEIERHRIPTQKVLQGAIEANLNAVVLVGWTPEGNLYCATSTSAAADVVYMLERFKFKILDLAAMNEMEDDEG